MSFVTIVLNTKNYSNSSLKVTIDKWNITCQKVKCYLNLIVGIEGHSYYANIIVHELIQSWQNGLASPITL